MQVGLLWFDNNPGRGLTAKVEDAAQRYRDKFGTTPNTCYVNQAALSEEAARVSMKGMRLVPASNILPHHFWIGVEDARERSRAAGQRQATLEPAPPAERPSPRGRSTARS